MRWSCSLPATDPADPGSADGTSPEGTPNGTLNEMILFNGSPSIETPAFLSERIDKVGDAKDADHSIIPVERLRVSHEQV